MKPIAAALLTIVPLLAVADVVGVVDVPGGQQLLLHDTAGPCVGPARLAEYVETDGSRVPGCWKPVGPYGMVSFLDGDRLDFPLAVARKPTSL